MKTMLRFLPIIAIAGLIGTAAVAANTDVRLVPFLFKGGVTIGSSGTKIDDSYAGSYTIDFASTAAQVCTDSAAQTLTGAAVNDPCIVGLPTTGGATTGTFTCYVSAADAVKIRYCNQSSGAIDPASATFTVRVIDP